MARSYRIWCVGCEASVVVPASSVRIWVWDEGEAHYALSCPFCGGVIARLSGCVTLTSHLIGSGAPARWVEEEWV